MLEAIRMAISEAKGIYVKDADGNLYFDCLAGAGTLALGHNHPVVLDALRAVLDANLPLHTLDLTTPVKDAFVEELFASLPPEFARKARIQFCAPSGADAVEAALKLVKTATGRRSVLSFHGGKYKGRGLMIGVEIVNPEVQAAQCGSYPAHSMLASCIQAECLRRGLIIEIGGRFGSVVRFLPPLIVTGEQIDNISEIFQESVKAAEKQVLPILSEVG